MQVPAVAVGVASQFLISGALCAPGDLAVSSRRCSSVIGRAGADLQYGLAPSPESYRANELIGDADAVLSDLVLFGPHPGIDLRGDGYESLRKFAAEVLPTLNEG